AMLVATAQAAAAGTVVTLDVDGPIGVATSDYLVSGLEHAAETDAELVILRLDTPGGLVTSTRDIVKAILASPVPVATFVAPAGARADSAGTYILLASHVAAMAPTTHIGAATPVSITGDDLSPRDLEDRRGEDDAAPADDGAGRSDDTADDASDDATDGAAAERGDEDDEAPAKRTGRGGTAMDNKVMNDAVAYIRALAERYGRNADWAEAAVRDAATLTARQALEQNVVDFVADDEAELLRQIDGHEVLLATGTVALDTGETTLVAFEADWRIKLLSVISNPEIVLILGMIGLYGLMYEGWNPGAIVPGVVGVICLLLAAYALQVIPVNYAGLALIVIGLALMTAEAFAPSFGALGLGGVAAFVFGAIIMFDSEIPGFGISVAFVVALGILAALAIVGMMSYLVKLRKRGAVSGRGSIVGGIGIAMEDFAGNGRVWLEGEAWAAYSEVPLTKDQDVVVTSMEGLTLYVRPAPVQRPSTQMLT
ncbi:MAG TPA: nodulation protein NfeD, partial [Woeseiaceae bacterium]|nr:nodulation protein NfeD [Woeseiaceae bacterium]